MEPDFIFLIIFATIFCTFLEISKGRLEMVLGSLLWVALLGQGLDEVASRGSCQPHPLSVILQVYYSLPEMVRKNQKWHPVIKT